MELVAMFCSNCGAAVSGNFCSKCGAPLNAQPNAQSSMPSAPPNVVPQDWSGQVRYDQLITIPEVRTLIAQAASAKQQHLSAEDFLGAAEKLIALAGPAVPLKTLAEAAVPIFQQMGLKTGKTRSITTADLAGTSIVKALCSFAREGQDISQVQQFEDGCLIEATLPSDFRSWTGSILVTIHANGSGSEIQAATSIKGQMFDWGKSNQCLNKLFLAFGSPPAPSAGPRAP